MADKKPELKRCPFCDGECKIIESTIYIGGYEIWFRAGCRACQIWTDVHSEPEFAAAKWDSRANE